MGGIGEYREGDMEGESFGERVVNGEAGGDLTGEREFKERGCLAADEGEGGCLAPECLAWEHLAT